jgi:hypothetical protein
MKSAGYSNSPLAKKLGIKEGTVMKVVNSPGHYRTLFTDFPMDVRIIDSKAILKDIIHLFVRNEASLVQLLLLKEEIKQNGCIWVSWPKKTSTLFFGLTEDRIRSMALEVGLVDVKVCAIDTDWSGLKLMIPVKDRHMLL